MKAVILSKPGQLEVVNRPMPQRATGEVLLQICRAGICGTDLLIFQGHMANRATPGRILGHELMGIIREPSESNTFRPGDRVTVEPTLFCGNCAPCRSGHGNVCQDLRLLGIDRDGAFQEFWTVPEHRIHPVPASIPDDHAAMVEPLAVAVHDVRLAALQPGETVAVLGGGTIGLFIAHLARRAHTRVIVFEIDPFRLDFARRQGFEALDSREKDPASAFAAMTQGAGAQAIFEASGSAAGARLMTAIAAVRGRIVVVGIHGRETPTDLFHLFFRELTIQGARAYARRDFEEAIRLLASGEIRVGEMISKRYALEEVQQAMESAVAGDPVMKLIVTVSESS